jgi:hypothetical protein
LHVASWSDVAALASFSRTVAASVQAAGSDQLISGSTVQMTALIRSNRSSRSIATLCSNRPKAGAPLEAQIKLRLIREEPASIFALLFAAEKRFGLSLLHNGASTAECQMNCSL